MSTETNFHGLGIAPKFLEILHTAGFSAPTPIQKQSIPVAITGKDVIGIAQTGTGKTLAFGIPLLQRLVQHKGRALIVLPTRELALQVHESLHNIGKPLGLKTAVLIGGEAIGRQVRALRLQPHVLIATPGRLIDHLEQGSVRLHDVKILVLDEADRMLDMGFMPQIKKILHAVPKERQTLLFSATMPAEIVSIATGHMKLPVRVEVAPAGTAAERVSQELFFVSKDAKTKLLVKLLRDYTGSTLVFTRTKFGAKKLARIIRREGYGANELHSDRSLNQRIDALNGFKVGKYRVLVATDIAARGIDVSGIELVVNYDLPEQAEDYVHRIGRTGRAGKSGHAISFATPDQRRDVKTIERLIRAALPVSTVPELAPLLAVESADEGANFDSRRRSGGRSFRSAPRFGSRSEMRDPKTEGRNNKKRFGKNGRREEVKNTGFTARYKVRDGSFQSSRSK